MNGLSDDIWMALTRLLRDWRYTFAASICLAAGTAAVISVFTIVNLVVLKPLPFHEPDRLVMIRGFCPIENEDDAQTSIAEFLDWQTQCTTMELAAYQLRQLDLAVGDQYQRMVGFRVSRNFFTVLHAEPYMGLALDQTIGNGNLQQIMLSVDLWEQFFARDQDLVGNVVRINSWLTWPTPGSRGYELTGILPEDMRYLPSSSWLFNSSGFGPASRLQFCMPMDLANATWRDFRSVDAIGRLKPGVTREEAQAEMELIAARLEVDYPDSNAGWSIRLVPLHEYAYRRVNQTLVASFVASSIVLLLACGTAAHVLLIRSGRRAAEMAISSALGATPNRLGRQAAIEVVALTACACTIGLVLARYAILILNAIAPGDMPRAAESRFDTSVILFTCLVAAACCMAIGALPLWRVLTPNIGALLSVATRTVTQTTRAMKLLRAMVAFGVASSYVLLVAAGLLVLKMQHLMQVDPGFEPDNRLTMTIALPEAKHEWNQNTSFCHNVMDGVRDLPGVVNVAAIQGLPMGRNKIGTDIFIEGKPLIRESDLPNTYIRVVTDGYFETMGIPVVRGRTFQPNDSIGEIGQTRVVIVNETMAEECWPGEDPIGRRLKTFQAGSWLEVIGVVGDVRSEGLDRPPVIDMYFPEKLFPQPHIVLVVETSHNDPMALSGSTRSVIHQADPDAGITHVATMNDIIEQSQASDRYFAVLLTTLALVGTVLAMFGILLTTLFSVSQRSRELAIRICCGATPRDIVTLVVVDQLKQIAVGIVLGGTLCFALVHVVDLPWETARYFQIVAWTIVPGGLSVLAVFASATVAIRAASKSSVLA